MPLGIEIRLYDGTTPQASKTGLTCLWWDASEVYDFAAPQGRTEVAATDADGDLVLDLSGVSGHSVGGVGYLLVRKEDGTDHRDSLVFQGRVQTSTVTGGTKLEYQSGWVRPVDWLDLGTLPASGENKFIGLYSVWKGGANWCAFKFTCSDASQYTVSWGDGTANENINSGTTVQHSFNYDNCAASSETGIAAARACTFQDTGDTVTLAGYGFQNGTEISFSNVTTTTGISAYTRYWVRDVSGDTFKVAATKGGTALALTNNGTGAVYLPGHRQALITVVPTTSGKEFTALDMHLRHTSASLGTYATGWLDVYLNAPSMTTLDVCGTGTVVVAHRAMERFQALELGAITNWGYMFNGCSSLQSVSLPDTSAGTDFTGIFFNCFSLLSAPLFDTSNGTSFSGAFSGCYSLKSIPLFDLGNCLDASYLLSYCYALKSFPAFNLGSAATLSYAFANMTSLRSVPFMDTGACTNFSYMCTTDTSLRNVPPLNVSAGTNFGSIFTNNYSLERAALSGTLVNINYNSGPPQLSGSALDEIYTNLGTVTAKTINVTGNYGVASDNPSIATAKGWTVTG